MIKKSSNQRLTIEELEKMVNTNSNQSSTPSNNNLWIGIGVGGILVLVMGIIMLFLVRKSNK